MKNLNEKTIKYLFWVIFILSLSLVVYGCFLKQQDEKLPVDAVLEANLPPPDLDAVSYLVGEINSGKLLIKRNGNLHLFPASLTKLMTAMVVLENFSLNEEITISPYAVSTEGEEGGLVAGEKIKVDDLLKILLISSSNDAAIAFEEALGQKGGDFVALMNKKARKIGLFNSAFFDATGLDRKGNFTSIEDLFKLSQEIYKNYPYIGEITRKKEDTVYSVDKKIIHNIKNTNILTGKIYNLWGGKTGSTPEARDCLLTIYGFPFPKKNDKMVVSRQDFDTTDFQFVLTIIVLNSSDRFGDTMKLYDWARQQIAIANNKQQ